jgi:proliferating cell nuclear antigen
MLLKLTTPKSFIDVIGIISELVNEVKIKINKEGLSIVAIDPANVSLVSFVLPVTNFSEFEAKEETVCVNLESLKPVLKRYKSGSLIMKTSEDKLIIELEGKVKRIFEIALIDINEEEKAVPPLEFNVQIEMNNEDFYEAIEDCKIVSDVCDFFAKNEKFVLEARGLHSSRSEFSNNEIKISGEGKARYSLEYLQKFIKGCKISDKLVIGFSDDYPLKLEFISKNFNLIFILAPRTEIED